MALALGTWVQKDMQLPRDVVKLSGKRNCEGYNKIIKCHTYSKAWFRGRQRDGWGEKGSLCRRDHEYLCTVCMESKG